MIAVIAISKISSKENDSQNSFLYNLVPRAFPLKMGRKSPGNEVAFYKAKGT